MAKKVDYREIKSLGITTVICPTCQAKFSNSQIRKRIENCKICNTELDWSEYDERWNKFLKRNTVVNMEEAD